MKKVHDLPSLEINKTIFYLNHYNGWDNFLLAVILAGDIILVGMLS